MSRRWFVLYIDKRRDNRGVRSPKKGGPVSETGLIKTHACDVFCFQEAVEYKGILKYSAITSFEYKTCCLTLSLFKTGK